MSKSAYISFAPGPRWLDEDTFLDQLKPLGVTRRGFRAWLHSLGVPIIHIGKVRMIDQLSFSLALRAISRIGQPDYFAPGCDAIHKGLAKTSTLDQAYVTKNLEIIISELLAARRLFRGKDKTEVAKAAREAARRMVLAGLMMTQDNQDEFARHAVANARRDGTLNWLAAEERIGVDPDAP